MKKRSKKALAFMLTVAVIFALAGCSASPATDWGANPTVQNTPSPEPTEPVVHDLSTAEADGFEIEAGVLTGYHGPNSDVMIPEGVVVIAGLADLYSLDGIRSIHIPSTVREIGEWAFNGCKNLERVEFETGGQMEIAESAFGGCGRLSSVTFPEDAVVIAGFNNCDSLTTLTFPESVTEIGGRAEYNQPSFSDCEQLTTVTILNGDAWIRTGTESRSNGSGEPVETPVWTFQNCPNLTICAPAGGRVEEFAINHNIPFSPL